MKITETQKELAQYLVNLNAEAKANGSPFAIMTEIEHWADIGVYSVKDFETYDARCTLSDLYKDVNGIRPRWMNIWEMSLEEVNHELESLRSQLAREVEAEENARIEHDRDRAEHKRRWNEAVNGQSLTQGLAL
jgi:hypothetical protein